MNYNKESNENSQKQQAKNKNFKNGETLKNKIKSISIGMKKKHEFKILNLKQALRGDLTY